MNSQPTDPSVMTVSQLTGALQSTLRREYSGLWVSGEVSGVSRPQSGHVYLNLSDENAQIKAVIWRSVAQSLPFEVEDGMSVLCRGDIDIYPPRGSYQLVIRRMESVGQGALQLAFKQLQAKLEKEGLFDPNRKQALPQFPSRIGIVSSPTGAAIRDFLQVTLRRWPNIQCYLIPCRVQGTRSANEIAAAIETANRLQPELDVLVVTRGGGSAEDLWAFNEEPVVRAVAASQLPVISAVGHEIDVTLCDLAADRRALTPSEAGELVVPEKRELLRAIDDLKLRLGQSLRHRTRLARARLQGLARRRVLQYPQDRIRILAEQVDDLDLRMQRQIQQHVRTARQQIEHAAVRLNSVSPLQVLARGYSVTQTDSGEPLSDASQLKEGQIIRTILEKGELISSVREVRDTHDSVFRSD